MNTIKTFVSIINDKTLVFSDYANPYARYLNIDELRDDVKNPEGFVDEGESYTHVYELDTDLPDSIKAAFGQLEEIEDDGFVTVYPSIG